MAQLSTLVPSRKLLNLLQTMGLPSNAPILDAPSGFGRNSLALADRGYNVVAVDKDVNRLASLENSKADVLGLGRIDSVCVDLTNVLPFDRLTFSAVLCVHYPVQTAIAELHRILKGGGLFYIETFGGQGGNFLQLPKAGEVREFLMGYEFHFYQERAVGPISYGAVALTLAEFSLAWREEHEATNNCPIG